MDINELTIGQAKELSSFFGGSENKCVVPVQVGKAYLFRTVTNYYVGEVICAAGQFVTLTKASWVADTGRFSDALETGELKEVEPYKNNVTINSGAFIDFTEWVHDLPTVQK